ncbi:MAG: pseudouridine synthase [Methylicorpusculum sp.]|uniref:23S rRNA pseudouridine(2605) synthase RluB n=1 Tax=Methylicorpusculum sp. TaxID=2713644 RepID=UPI002716CC16|nr:pseudouridine synthase [Methylicorpusculum sp.]MDO8939346.1 pseudouridine synthase [Methylicorpusculum sp.]MDP2201706.1 pseudouridine synthase [Methylicorpusculum sp.]
MSAPKAPSANLPVGDERISKVLARGGVGSRREIERWIDEGRLMLNGVMVKQGDKLQPGDHLQLNGRIIHWQRYAQQPTRILIYHKPTGEVVTRRDPEGRPVIFTQLPKLQTGRWIAVGRLDINTSGLLLVTNNGELANRMMHPSSELEREYAVRILGDVDEVVFEKLKKGVELEDGIARFNDIKFQGGEGANKWYHVVVTEGRNRLVRRLWESQNVTVSRLIRIRYGAIAMPDGLKAHSFYEMTMDELNDLLDSVGLSKERAIDQSPSYDKTRKKENRPIVTSKGKSKTRF